MPEQDKRLGLVVGLGNPGERYAATRHNAGAWFVERLAARFGEAFRPVARLHAEACQVTVDGHRLWLIRPTTFMNHSGRAVAAFSAYYKIPHAQILVAHDELDFPAGVVRVKRGGGDGGHRGLHDIIAHLGHGDFLRLRIGIGHPGSADEVVDYVLHRPSAAEQVQLDAAIEAAVEQFPALARGDVDAAMRVLHRREAAPGAPGAAEQS